MLNPAERILEIEVRSGATLDEQLNLRTLKFDEWQAKVTSAEYRAIEKKLADRTARPTPQAENGVKPEREVTGSPPTKESHDAPQSMPETDATSSDSPPSLRNKSVTGTAINSWFDVTLLSYVAAIVLIALVAKRQTRS